MISLTSELVLEASMSIRQASSVPAPWTQGREEKKMKNSPKAINTQDKFIWNIADEGFL